MLGSRTVLVTGGSKGIGRGIAERLWRDGAFGVVRYAHDERAAKGAVSAIERAGGRACPLHAELGAPGDAERLWAAFDALAEQGLDGVAARRVTGQTIDATGGALRRTRSSSTARSSSGGMSTCECVATVATESCGEPSRDRGGRVRPADAHAHRALRPPASARAAALKTLGRAVPVSPCLVGGRTRHGAAGNGPPADARYTRPETSRGV